MGLISLSDFFPLKVQVHTSLSVKLTLWILLFHIPSRVLLTNLFWRLKRGLPTWKWWTFKCKPFTKEWTKVLVKVREKICFANINLTDIILMLFMFCRHNLFERHADVGRAYYRICCCRSCSNRRGWLPGMEKVWKRGLHTSVIKLFAVAGIFFYHTG